MTKLSRRRFLGVAAGVAGSALMGARVSVGQTELSAPSALDVAIVGGGMAGLFCAMRLGAAGLKVGLFEASDRLGGRVLSVTLPGFSEHVAEIGAMRLRSTDSVETKLIDTLLGDDAKADFAYPTRAWFLRDRLLHELNVPTTLPYALDEAERAILRDGKNLLAETVRQLASSGTAGLPASDDRGVWEMILKARSKEGQNFIVDTLGYTTLTSNWNAAAGLSWFQEDFAPGTAYFKVKGGLQRLPNAMEAAYVKAGGLRNTRTRLRRIDRPRGGDMVLTFETPDGVRQLSAKRVILALTPRAIEELHPDSFILQDGRFRAALKSVAQLPLGKMHLSFERAWWEQAGYDSGRIVTDLPLRQTFLWGKNAETGRGLTIASYHDGPATGFWRALATGESYGPDNWIAAARGPGGAPLPPSLRDTLPVSRLMAEETWDQMKRINDIPVPRPLLGTYRNWGDDPLYGAGYHLWTVGVNARIVAEYMREPFPGLYVCGEAWSDDQGWIKGATTTAEAVLQQKFGLPPYVSA